MLKQDRPAKLGSDDARVDVARRVLLLPPYVGLREGLPHVFRKVRLKRAHGDEAVKGVAVVDSHIVGNRAKSMGRIEIAIADHVRNPSPEALTLLLRQDPAEVMDIGGFAVDD